MFYNPLLTGPTLNTEFDSLPDDVVSLPGDAGDVDSLPGDVVSLPGDIVVMSKNV